eukprot:g61865.t1
MSDEFYSRPRNRGRRKRKPKRSGQELRSRAVRPPERNANAEQSGWGWIGRQSQARPTATQESAPWWQHAGRAATNIPQNPAVRNRNSNTMYMHVYDASSPYPPEEQEIHLPSTTLVALLLPTQLLLLQTPEDALHLVEGCLKMHLFPILAGEKTLTRPPNHAQSEAVCARWNAMLTRACMREGRLAVLD